MAQRAVSNIVEQCGHAEEEHEVLVRRENSKSVIDSVVINPVGVLKGLTGGSCLADLLLIVQNCIQKFSRKMHHSDAMIEPRVVG